VLGSTSRNRCAFELSHVRQLFSSEHGSPRPCASAALAAAKGGRPGNAPAAFQDSRESGHEKSGPGARLGPSGTRRGTIKPGQWSKSRPTYGQTVGRIVRSYVVLRPRRARADAEGGRQAKRTGGFPIGSPLTRRWHHGAACKATSTWPRLPISQMSAGSFFAPPAASLRWRPAEPCI
jgi:hypothetical protein